MISQSIIFERQTNPVTYLHNPKRSNANLYLILLILIELFQLKLSIFCAHTSGLPHISDRLCSKISSKLQSNYNSSTLSSHHQHNDTLIYLSQRDGAKYPFWIQCLLAPLDSVSNGSHRIVQGELISSNSEKNNQDADLGTIFDEWANSIEPSELNQSGITDYDHDEELNNQSFNRTGRRKLTVQDERYYYLLSVAHQCWSLKHAGYECLHYKIGLFAHQESTLQQNGLNVNSITSNSLNSSIQKCPACGLNDLNCENVSQCTSACGQIKSINYPQNYGNNHRCRWSIRAPEGYYVNVSVIDFDIPSANNATKLGTCIFDYLTLIDGYTGKRIGCYCNENLPPAYIVSPWNELIIQFDTNSETTGRGFYFQYEFFKLQLNDRIQGQLINNNVCLPSWQYFRGSCYKAYNEIEPLQWYDAESKCNYYGEGLDGHLVSILDRDEMLVILYWLTNVWNSTRYREYYIGLIDVTREGVYRWSDNNPMSYTDWELKSMLLEDETPAQPDGGAYEDCTVIRYNSFSRTSNWHDIPCSLGKHYHSHLEKDTQVKFKWDYVSSYICKSDSISMASPSLPRSKIRRPLFSNEFKPSLQADYLISHLSGSNNQRSSSIQSTSPIEKSTNSANLSGQNQLLTLNQAPIQSSSIEYSDQRRSQLQKSSSQMAKTALRYHQDVFYLSKLDDNRYFICDNLEVISTVLRCDGVAHCRDGSDESIGCDQDCLDWQFKCANGRCISVGYYCDFNDDCGDGSDESRCERHRCKLNEFRCQSGQCIQNQQRCDLLPDCRDSSDEGRSCTIGSNCNPLSTFQCYNGLCIPQYAVCDFQIDCPGKFHEDEDTTTCDLYQRNQGFAAAAAMAQSTPQATISGQQSTLIARSKAQANEIKRPAVDWRTNPTRPTSEVIFYPANRAASVDYLPDNLFRCKSGNTIDVNQRCLFEFDKYGYQLGCRDVSHLVDCNDFVCPQRDYVKCPNSYCIPWRYVCDGKWDCIMGDDEVGCARYVCPGQYKCANQSSCILLHQLCDGYRQCPMGDDEWFCDLQCPIGCDCIGQSVNCRGANLSSLASNFIPKAVRKLDLSYNKLGPNLSNTNFDSYHDLGELILSHNQIEVLTPRKFLQLRNLYKLDLSYNQIHSVKRGAFAGLRRVTQLLLESNQQLFLLEPEAFLGLSSLQMLNISSSKIQSLKKNTFDGLTSLRHLLLRSNMILTIEDGAFRSLTSLVSLDIRGNDIKHFTKLVFTDLKSLRNLSSDSFKFCCLMNHQIPADKCLPLPDEISDCEDLLSSVHQRACIYIAGFFACAGNLIVIVYRCCDRLGQKEREEERVNSSLLLSLGFSDFLMGIYLVIIAIADTWYRGHYIENVDKWRASFLCNLCGLLATISSTVSMMTLIFIAYNRYLEICRPFKMASKFTLGYTQRLITSSWMIALITAIFLLVVWPYFSGQFYAKSGVCLAFHITDQRTDGWFYSILVSSFVNLVAFMIIFCFYIRIYLEISRARRRNEQIERSNHQIKIMLIVLTHFVAFSPPMILGFMSLAGYTLPAALYSWIAVLVLPVNSAINPMIYTIPNARHTLRMMIKNYRVRKSAGVSAVWLRGREHLRANSIAIGANLNNGSTYLPATATATATNGGQAHIHLDSIHKEAILSQSFAKSLADSKLAKSHGDRNVPPGYVPVRQFLSRETGLNISHLVKIALEIAHDIEIKHKRSKVYASLQVDDVFVSDKLVATDSEPPSLAVYLSDHDGYRPRKSQICSLAGHATNNNSSNNSNNNSHHHHHRNHHCHRDHKNMLTCECSDVARFGDILFKLLELYNRRKSNSN